MNQPVTIERFQQWLRHANPGSRITYHVGNLAFDRQNVSRSDRDAVHALGNAAWHAGKAGAVSLVQRRIDPGVCAYEAVVT